ncbi:MAG: M23 family metallopeptidase [Geitlerinemataceae cyanobacterium]
MSCTQRCYIYRHLNEVFVSPGQQVSAGDLVGTVGGRGETPNQLGLHLQLGCGDPEALENRVRP